MTDQSPSEPIPCPPCRGTGEVTSKLGGEPHQVPCPWCEGSGVLIPEHDAQAVRRAEAADAADAADTAD